MKKIIKGLIIISILILVSTIYQLFTIKNTKQIIYNYNTEGKSQIVHDSIKNYEITICNLNIFKPKIAYVSYSRREDRGERHHVSFYDFQKENIFFGQWNFDYTGGTTIRNTTFPELLKMVKEDCYQFQKPFGNYDDLIMNWSYSKAKPKLSEEEKKEKEEEKIQEDIEQKKEEISKLTEKKQKELKERYGYDENFTDEKFVRWVEDTDFTGFESGEDKPADLRDFGLKIIE